MGTPPAEEPKSKEPLLMSQAAKQDLSDARVALLCPNCGKRLPLSGRFSVRGTAGVFCRGCQRTVQISMDMEEDCAGAFDAPNTTTD